MMRLPSLELVTAVLTAATGVISEVRRTVRALVQWRKESNPATSYITDNLELDLDIADDRGHKAVLTRRQRITFLVGESGVVREPVWGDGDALAHYRVDGAQRLGVRPEGMTRAVLLGLGGPATPGERATVTSRRTIRGGLLGTDEYLAAHLERPTGRLSLRVRFPRSRPPRTAQIVCLPAKGPPLRLAVRVGRDGRPVLSWRARNLADPCTYVLRWSW